MIAPQSLVWIVVIFAAVCLWQLLAGLAKIRQARRTPGDPRASVLAKIGWFQALASGAMLLANVALNLPLLRAMF